jgi:hypothetical protein
MATHEAELKEIRQTLALLEAEFEANREELYGNNDSQVESRPAPLPKRRYYLELRNTYLEEKIGELKKKAKAKEDAIAWENRTR